MWIDERHVPEKHTIIKAGTAEHSKSMRLTKNRGWRQRPNHRRDSWVVMKEWKKLNIVERKLSRTSTSSPSRIKWTPCLPKASGCWPHSSSSSPSKTTTLWSHKHWYISWIWWKIVTHVPLARCNVRWQRTSEKGVKCTPGLRQSKVHKHRALGSIAIGMVGSWYVVNAPLFATSLFLFRT